MNANEFLDSIELLLGRGLDKEARHLFNRIKKEDPGMLNRQAWDNVRNLIPTEPTGMAKGYKFERERCSRCGAEVASNWIVRHRKNNCKIAQSR